MTVYQDQELSRKSSPDYCARCGKEFEAFVAMQLCPECREQSLSNSSSEDFHARNGVKSRPTQEETNEWHFIVGDWKIIDEFGNEVWARDLADRYRKELKRRKAGDYRIQHKRSSSR